MLKKVILLLLFYWTTPVFSSDYFWIGGSGNWSDLSHWATTSGGNVTHSQVPTSEDNVIFDQNSITGNNQTVTLNTDIVFFRNMDWTAVNQNVRLVGGRTVIMSCFGYLDLGNTVSMNFAGTLNFTGSQNNSQINFNGNLAGREVYFIGSGSWNLTSSMEVDSVLEFSEGTFISGGNNIRTRYFNISRNNSKVVNLENSIVEVWGNYGRRENYNREFDTITAKINTVNLDLLTSNSTFRFTNRITETWFFGDESLFFSNMEFTDPNGQHVLESYNSDPEINYESLAFAGSAKLLGRIDAENLTLGPTKLYELRSGTTFQFGTITAPSDCGGSVAIIATDNGSHATINSPSGITIDYVTLRDIHATGGTFTANHGADLGNNDNWTFTNNASVDYYWVGGSGDWLDPSHWALSSGGPSSGCVPTGKDNAFFDNLSFNGASQLVTINAEDIFINDMIWDGATGNPDLTGDQEFSMHIGGSLRLDDNMNHTFGGYYYFESQNTGNTIELNGKQFNRELHFSGPDAEWSLMDDVYVVWNLSHHSGTIIANGNNLDFYKYLSYGDQPRTLNIEGSYVITHDVSNGNYLVPNPSWEIETTNFQLLAANSTIELFSIYYVRFYNSGENKLVFNNIISSAYGIDISGGFLPSYDQEVITVDSLIINLRSNINDYLDVNYLRLSPGFDCRFSEYGVKKINELDANGSCMGGHIIIQTFRPGQSGFIELNSDQNCSRLIVEDMTVTGGVINATQSIDEGNNSGWVFSPDAPRVLYWVGNTGSWYDESHWSLSSGGPGGECIPTSIDDVIFDENSFDQNNQSVYSNQNQMLQCHNISWINVIGNPTFGGYYDSVEDYFYGTDNIQVFGSVLLDENMNNNIFWYWLKTNELDSVITNGTQINGIVKNEAGKVVFKDDLLNYNFEFSNGDIEYEDIVHYCNWYNIYSDVTENTMNSIYNNSTIRIGREGSYETQFRDFGNQHNLDIGTTTIYFESYINRMYINNGNNYYKVISTRPEGELTLIDRNIDYQYNEQRPEYSMQYLRFSGDGNIYGSATLDTLIGSAGKTYQLEHSKTQRVNNYLQLIGNNCTPIELKSSQSGTKATINMPSSSEMLVDFVEMQDNRGTGGAEFIAGSRSTNIAMSNEGWIFDDPPEFQETGFLGVDRALCNNASLKLSAFNYSPNEEYVWDDNSTDTTRLVSQTGEYSVTVTFDNGCEITDQIIILEPQDAEISLGNDTSICEGTSILVDGSLGIQNVDYIWNDGITDASREIDQEGIYSLTGTIDGCLSVDSIMVTVQPIPVVDIGGDTTLCENETLTLDAEYQGPATYLWQDGTIFPELTISAPGIYWAEIQSNNCFYRDSIEVTYVEDFILELGNDTTLCDGHLLTIDLAGQDDVLFHYYEDDVFTDFYEIGEPGEYIIEGIRNGCMKLDTINVDFQMAPGFAIEDSIIACEGDTILLDAGSGADNYEWSTGELSSSINVNFSGTYTIRVDFDLCTIVDSTIIEFYSYPEVDLGEEEISICDGDQLVLDAGATGIWQDGSINNTFTVSEEGEYKVTLSNQGCMTSDSTFVMVLPLPEVALGEDITSCIGEEVSINAPEELDNFTWDDGSDTDQRIISLDALIWIESELNGCINRDSLAVTFNPIPVIDLGPDTTVCDDAPYFVTPVNNEGNITWQNGSQDEQFLVEIPGQVTATTLLNGCEGSDSVIVDFKSCVYFEAYLPNVFSPNGDGENDQFYPQFPDGIEILDYNLKIFDRWGSKVFESRTLDDYWKGDFTSSLVDSGVYIYVIDLEYRDDREQARTILSGDILVLK